MIKEFALSDEDMQLLKISLLTFVRRVAFQGAQSGEEARAFFPIVNLLLGIPVALELNLDDLLEDQEEEVKPNDVQESENGKTSHVREYQHIVEWRHKHGLVW